MADELQGSPQAAPQAPLNPDLAGYPNVESLVQGYRASSTEAKRWRDEAERAAQQLQATQQQIAANPRPQVPQRDPDPYNELKDYGVPVDAFREAVRSEIQREFAPLARGFQARNKVLSDYPDYNKFEADVAQFIGQDPNLDQSYRRMFDADPVGAMEYAFLKFGESRRRAQPQGNGSGNPSEAAHAAIPGQRGGDARRAPSGPDADVRDAWERYRQSGSTRDAASYAKARLGPLLEEQFAKSGQSLR